MGESFSAELSTGIARFHVPFDLGAARGAAQPSLGLAYASSGGQGIAGIGWGVGVPAISRQMDRGIPKYQDPPVGGPWHPEQDRFVSGADELVPICLVAGTACTGAVEGEVMPQWASGWQYFRTRVEGGFLRYFWSPNHRTWRVQSKNGISMEFGVPLDGSADEGALEADPSTPTRIYAWHVVRMYDAMGEANPSGQQSPRPVNLVQYRYERKDGTTYLKDIYDTPPAANAADAPVSSYAHHTHLRYGSRPDVMTSYRRGWRVRVAQRLEGVDVTSHDFHVDEAGRQLVRRYHLSYAPDSHVSLLESVATEGRCANPVRENGAEGLLASTSCPRLPAMTFGYQHVAPFRADGTAASTGLPGYEGFDERIRDLASSPPHSISESLTDLVDVDSDGLPDVLVTDPARYDHHHGVFFNKGSGFASVEKMAVDGVLDANVNDIKFSNPNLSSHDVDGDGTVNLLHMPLTRAYSIYTPRYAPELGPDHRWAWEGRVVATASQQSPKIDFAHRNADIRLMDVNADGLIDVVHTAGTEVQTFLSLGRYPAGDGQYGHASWTGPSTADISNDPLTSCIPWSALPVRFSDPDVHVADMNGDGFPDIVRVRHGDIRYWPGRGTGFWGTGDPAGCQAGTFGQDQHVPMENSPLVGLAGEEPFLLDDVNGDGLADFVKVRFNAIDISLNVDGVGWTDRHTIENAPENSTITNRVRLTDINGSGTPDILWGDGYKYRYIDLAGGVRPWVLTRVENGLGATTELEYTTSVQEMLAAEATEPWTSKAPTIAHVLKRAIHRDNLDRIGRAAGTYVTGYTYRDAVYEGRQREFRGFRTVRSRTVGDSNSPSSIAEATFLLGECVEEPGASGNCVQRWRDNPREALKGLAVVGEELDESGTYLSTAHTTYRLRQLYTGLDGRAVRHAFAVGADSYRYDTSAFAPSTSSHAVADVELEATQGDVVAESPRSVALRGAGRARIRHGVNMDRFGNVVDQDDYGCTEGCGAVDEKYTAHSTPQLVVGDASGWIWRTSESWTQGSRVPTVKRNHVSHQYDARGTTISESVHITGTLPLDRFHEDGGASVAPAPANAVADGSYDTFNFDHDAFGNVTHSYGPAGHCGAISVDGTFAQLVVQTAKSTGFAQSAVGLAACGPYSLTTSASYDRGFGVVTQLIDSGLQASMVTYDGFGRPTAMYLPDPEMPTLVSAVPSMKFEYFLPTDALTPVSRVHTSIQDGPTADDVSFAESWSFVDGLGRPLATMTQDEIGGWIVRGDVDYDAKGAVRRRYQSYYGGAPSLYLEDGSHWRSASTLYTSDRYDAFGRGVETRGLDDQIALRNVFGAMSTDVWDGADLQSASPHTGTPSTIVVDGHGRRIRVTQRLHAGAQLESQVTTTSYLATGEPETITRTVPGGASVVRWMRYDSFGRMVLNVDPNTTKDFNPSPTTSPNAMKAWRYAHDRLGQLVGTSDPRGCGVNFFYLADGRALGEDYSPCRAEHSAYSAPDLTTDGTAGFVKGDGLEVLYRYDGADPDAATIPSFPADPTMLGPNAAHVTSISDRGAKTVFHYDGRGRQTAIARRVAKPGAPADVLADRYAPHWFVKEATYDGAGRPVAASTGADISELLGSNASSVVTTEYSKRGTVVSVGSSYGDLVSNVTRDVDGLIEHITYGDVAQTSTQFQYDVRRRLASVVTDRGPPAIWSANPPAYTPAPNPSAMVFQPELEHYEFAYDEVDNPTAIVDLRDATKWPTSAKPSTRQLQYDDLYRVTRIDYSGNDDWTSPFAEENTSPAGVTIPSPHVSFAKRVATQTFAFDAVGNTTATDDDAHGFYDRSLGAITNGVSDAGPYRLQRAVQAAGTRGGELTAAYDAGGNLQSLAVQRAGPCLPTGKVCSQRFAYEWDEVGQLSRARRWDTSTPGLASDALPSGGPAAELRYAYADKHRVLKTAVDPLGNELHSVYIFGSLELRRARFIDDDYEHTHSTVAPYLFANGIRLARLYYAEEDVPTLSSGNLHVLFDLPDHLGSSSFVVDKATSELVEATRYQAYGAVESDYRPERWKAYRADYRFTGKEDDVEVGLSYFGARYFSASMNRWISPDPLAIHVPGEADLNLYAYVHGQLLRATDPFGLQATDSSQSSGGGVPMEQFSHTFINETEVIASRPAAAPTTPDASATATALPASSPAGFSSAPGPAAPSPAQPGATSTAFTLVDLGLNGGHQTQIPIGGNNYLTPGGVLDQVRNVAARQVIQAADPFHLARGAAKLVGVDLERSAMRPTSSDPQNKDRVVGAVLASVGITLLTGLEGAKTAAEASVARGGPSASSYVYQLVNEAGESVYYGLSNNPVVRLGQHARMPPGPFNGMQVISEALPLPQAQALETSLIQQANAEGRFIYNIAGSSISPTAPVAVPPTIFPNQSLLNPRLYIPR